MLFLLETLDDDYVTYTFFGYSLWHAFGGVILANPVVDAMLHGPAAQMIMNSGLAHYIGSSF